MENAYFNSNSRLSDRREISTFPILEVAEYRAVNRHWQEIFYQGRNITKGKILKHLKRDFGNTNDII